MQTLYIIYMAKLFDFLSRTPVLIVSFLAVMVVGAGFGFVEPMVGGALLDMKMNGADALARLGEMSPHHRKMHIIITATLDSLYPLSLFSFFAGLAARLAKSWRRFAVVPAFVYMIADFIENGVQILALKGSENLLNYKDILTPLKFYAIAAAALLVLVLLLIAGGRKIRRKKA